MQKAVVIKQTWAIILMTPHYLLEASGGLHLHCSKEAGLLYTRGDSFSRSG